MRSHTFLILSITALLLGGISLASQATTIKCWTNKDGIRECGQTVPPEYSQKSHVELNDQGMVIKKEARAKSVKELEEEARLKKAKKEAELKEKEKARQDRILLDTFSTVDDIKMVRDEQLAALESNIKITQKRNEKVQKELGKRIKAAAVVEQSGRKPNKSLLDEINSLKSQLKNNNKFIEQKRERMKQTKQDYSKKIARFKELKGMD
ncbi:MAG: hypothetical protein P8126_10035 [Gammaproteobacteria bacterium]|jgi:hypothetical protein